MFFIKSGKVAAVFPKYNNFRFLKINPGYYFGEMDILFYSNIRRYTYVAIKDSEFYIISRKNFKKIFLVEFRDIGMEFVQESYLRKKRTKRIYLEALAACKIAFNNKKKDNIGLNWNNLPKMNNFKAKESIYDNNDNMGFGLNAEKLLAKKSFELKQEKEVSFLRKENDYFFKEEVDVEKPSENNIENALVDEKDDNNENNNLDANKNDEFAIETEKPKTNKLNLKLLINNVLDSNQNENHLPNTHENIDNVNLLPTPIKKSLAAYTFQKVLASNRKNKRMGMGENLKKVAQKETLKEKIKFFTDRVNKMDLDINNLIAFSRQLQIKYQDKIESLKAKPLPVNPLVPLNRKMRKNPTLSHINFIKSDSLKKKHNKNPMIPSRRKSDTTTARSFLANLGANNANLVGSNNNNNSEKNENSSKKLNKIPKTLQKTQAILRLQKLKDDIVRDRRNSLDQRGPKLERRPSFILKRKESILEEGSLVSQEQQELKDSMLKIKGKVSNSKNILQNANRRGSEMLSYRGSKSPKSVIGKNIFQNQFNSVSPPLKKKAFVLDIKPMKRTSSFIRRKSDRFVEISTGFNKNESGFFIEKTNRSIRKLSRKIILNSETDFLNDKKVKSNRRFSENLKNNGFANTLRNLEPLVRNANANPTITSSSKSEEMSDSVSRSKSSVRFMKSLKAKSSKFSLKSSKRSSKKSLKGTEKSRKLFNEEDEKIHEFRKEYNGEEKELIDGIDEYLVEKKNEDMVEKKKLKQIGNLKFMINLKDDRNSKK